MGINLIANAFDTRLNFQSFHCKVITMYISVCVVKHHDQWIRVNNDKKNYLRYGKRSLKIDLSVSCKIF